MNPTKCPFCEMGQVKRMLVWRLTKDLSRDSIKELLIELKKSNPKPRSILIGFPRPIPEFICPICKKICGNAGMLAMHMKSPGRPYREIHRKFELEKK